MGDDQMGMDEQITSDAAADRFADWGLSTVIDENVGTAVIPRDLFERLHGLAGIDAAWPIGNAGLVHVYGYLLSMVETPYGFKRDRWLDGSLATALGLPADAFLLDSPGGDTLLGRVTNAVLPLLRGTTDSELLRVDLAADGSPVCFRTLVVAAYDGAAALLYGVHDGIRMRAITAFPLASANHDDLRRIAQQRPRMRYNAATAELAPRSPLLPARTDAAG